MRTLNLVPAYGRDYNSKKAIIEHLEKNLDFMIADRSCLWDGKVANLEEMKPMYDVIYIRYGKLRKVCAIDMRKVEVKQRGL